MTCKTKWAYLLLVRVGGLVALDASLLATGTCRQLVVALDLPGTASTKARSVSLVL